MKGIGIQVPEDLLLFWSETGGGDCFESGTFFRPTTNPCGQPYFVKGDDFESANHFHTDEGMSTEYVAFHNGLDLSALRKADNKYVVLNSRYELVETYNDLDDWYIRTLRTDFAQHYGL
jgi:hypothetical protein